MDLSFNQIRTLNNTIFAGLSQLEKLKLGHNKISSIDLDAFRSLDNLTYFSMSSNRIGITVFFGSGNGVFDSLVNLVDLYVSDNYISSLDESRLFLYCEKLTRILLFDNYIKSMKPIVGPTHLAHVNFEIYYDTFCCFFRYEKF